MRPRSKESNLPIAYPRTEAVTYVECPKCDHDECLGTDVIWNDGAEYQCEKCGQSFQLRRHPSGE